MVKVKVSVKTEARESNAYLIQSTRSVEIEDPMIEIDDVNSISILESNLIEIPESVMCFKHLLEFDFGGRPSSPSSIAAIPEWFGLIKTLRKLNFDSCEMITMLPDSASNLVNMQFLNLDWCINLKALPTCVAHFWRLEHLSLAGCELMTHLPKYFTNLVSLKVLDLRYCRQLQRIPCWLDLFTNLSSLDMCMCQNIEAFDC
jgi:hypothetical protein